MGFFSFTCAKSNLPIMAAQSWAGSDEKCEVVVLFQDQPKKKVVGVYDGYGRVWPSLAAMNLAKPGTAHGSTQLLWEDVTAGRVKLVLAAFHDGETFEQLGKNGEELGQGHFLPRAWVDEAYVDGGWSSYEGYRQACIKANEEFFGQLGNME